MDRLCICSLWYVYNCIYMPFKHIQVILYIATCWLSQFNSLCKKTMHAITPWREKVLSKLPQASSHWARHALLFCGQVHTYAKVLMFNMSPTGERLQEFGDIWCSVICRSPPAGCNSAIPVWISVAVYMSESVKMLLHQAAMAGAYHRRMMHGTWLWIPKACAAGFDPRQRRSSVDFSTLTTTQHSSDDVVVNSESLCSRFDPRQRRSSVDFSTLTLPQHSLIQVHEVPRVWFLARFLEPDYEDAYAALTPFPHRQCTQLHTHVGSSLVPMLWMLSLPVWPQECMFP